jgi:predicted O-methyltransferase YrrM
VIVGIPTFDEVMILTSTIAHIHILQVVECQAMYETLCELPDGAALIEVGCDHGRSSSVITQIAAAKHFLTIHIDPWEEFKDRAKQWMEMMSERCLWHPFILLHMTTKAAEAHIARLTPDGIDFAFIDGSHDTGIIELDLEIVASRVKPGGFLLMHDYPSGGVTEATEAFVATGWTKYKQAYGLGIWKRL